jgi:3-phenylpropionate/trans-cinnamate dioxygenase ferredoxin reductase component
MRRFKYVIVGGGMTAEAAIRGIRKVDSEGPIAMIGDEPDPPYKRPPLTKALWKGKPVDTIWYNTADLAAEFILRRRVVRVDPAARQVVDHRGDVYAYERLLLATGGMPRRLTLAGAPIIYYRTFQDYQRLVDLTRGQARIAIIGGGFIGSELSAALAMRGQHVHLVFPDAALGARLFPPDLAQHLNEYYRARGVDVRPGCTVTAIAADSAGCSLRLSDGQSVTVDAVVAGIGITPDTALATNAGLGAADGIIVNEFLETTQPDIFAAGDVANFYNPLLGQRLRVEHEDNARTMGQIAGQCMAGAKTPYHHLPYFYSDLFDLGYEAIGDTDPRHVIVALWEEPFRKGVIFYLRENRVRGVIFWNVWNAIPAARELLAQTAPQDAGRLRAWVAQLPPG